MQITTLMAESEGAEKSLEESERGVKKLAQSLIFIKLRSWHLVPSPHGK